MLQTLAEDTSHSESAAGRHAVVIGGGLGGMAAALRLRAKGYRVTLFDRAPMLGGRAQVFQKDGFRYDAGPTVITAHFLFEELFALFGRRMEDYVTLVPLNPWYRFRFPDGDTFDYGGTIEETEAVPRIEWHQRHIVFHAPPEQREQLLEQEMRCDDGGTGIVAEAVLLEDLRPPAQHRRAIEQRDAVALGPQSERRRHAA